MLANPQQCLKQLSPYSGRLVARAAYAVESGTRSDEEALETSRQVFVSNLSYNTDTDSLSDAFSSVPGLQRAMIMMRDGRSRGMALVDYESHDAAEQAVQQFDQQELDGRTLSVRLSVPRAREPRRRDGAGEERRFGGADEGRYRSRYEAPVYGDDDAAPQRARVPREGREPRAPNPNAVWLFVGNLSYDTEWQEVKDHFASAGKVDFVKVKTTPEGRSRGFAVVQMSDEGSASAALSDLHNSELGGRQLLVRRYERREQQQQQ